LEVGDRMIYEDVDDKIACLFDLPGIRERWTKLNPIRRRRK
jgi:hypothetical protein